MTFNRPPVALSIAGTDPSGGAGIHADLKTFAARGVYGTTAITALVAQNTHGVSRVYPIDADFVADQLDSVLDDVPVDATKTGMLSDRGLVELVVDRSRDHDLGFLVVDPVMVATSGHRLLQAEAVEAVRSLLLPHAGLITPNLPEAALLLGEDVPEAAGEQAMIDQARELLARSGTAVLLKGGHAASGAVLDVLATADGVETFVHERIETPHTHGTGCTLSAAVTADLARLRLAASRFSAEETTGTGASRSTVAVDAEMLTTAVAGALDYLARALASGARHHLPLDPTGAHGPVDHLVDAAGQTIDLHNRGESL